ncbi:lanthionine synthetase LanC family protein [Pontibacter indicus]|uniref:Lanthionine synthetase C-like protein n=1 Tax=Pontibacter indicus TaxID=1317125 RepID=A0A1R3XQ01_9BACT|nr:lanthionine synthetase LanC family protein [Pontibacter indicus]SIT93986.1 Lanthionine synthetase C-like protein [Pontibacter indicus]
MGSDLRGPRMASEAARELKRLSVFDPEASDALYTGNLGKVISLLTLADYHREAAFVEEAVGMLQAVLERLGERQGVKFSSAMSNGLSGFGYVLLLLRESPFLGPEVDTQLLLDWVATQVFEKSKAEIARGDLDPMYSAMGGLYFLSRYAQRHPAGCSYVQGLVQALSARVQDDRHGSYLANRRYQPEARYVINTGLAHGLCGMVLVLTRVHASCPVAGAEALTRKLLAYLRALYIPYAADAERFLFPRSVSDEGVPLLQARQHSANIGWCTSDLSMAYAFLRAGHVLGDQTVTSFGETLLRDFLQFEQSGLPLQGANFCHGYAGFSWLYRKCFELTRLPACREAADYWLVRAEAFEAAEGDSLLDGRLGVCQVLLQRDGRQGMAWDEVFFL